MANTFVTKMIDDSGRPREAVVLRGYLATPEFIVVLEKLGRKDIPGADPAARAAVLAAARTAFGRNVQRIYLSARFDRWVDFATSDLIQKVPPDGLGNATLEDFSTTVWLKIPRHRASREPYRLVTSTVLAADEGFVRGKLVDDFMDDPASQVVWDEQGYVSAARRPSNIYCTA